MPYVPTTCDPWHSSRQRGIVTNGKLFETNSEPAQDY